MTASNGAQKGFDPSKSAKAQELLNMSPRAIFERYFVYDNNVSWIEDFNREKNATVLNNPEKDAYPLITSIIGQPLNVICSIIHKTLFAYIPVGYKLNSKNIIKDLEVVLSENMNETRKAAVTKKATPFIWQLAQFFVEIYNQGIEYKSSLNV